jgi:glyoxylase-like metal-dependent hydrolase (beta-lactamase superfamily II)
VKGSIEALDHLASLNADTYIPGHGPLVHGKDALYRARDYLTYIRDEAWKRFKEGMPYDRAARDIDLKDYNNWFDKERVIGNVARAYSEFRGEPLGSPLSNLNEVVAEMIKYRAEVRLS